ncbi:MAG: class I SAM-dependent methyltransferase [Blautia sp.]
MADYKKLSENTFNIQAKTYDTDKNGKHARNLYQHVIDTLSTLQFSNVLDVGCGTGEILSAIGALYPTVSLLGIDISQEMLKQAKSKEIDNVKLYLGDAEHLPFENARFNVLICTDSFHHYPKPQRAIDEFYRVLQNNGHILLADFWKPFPIRQLMNSFIPFSNEGDVKIYSRSEILSFLKHSGFQDIQYQKINKSSYLVVAKK